MPAPLPGAGCVGDLLLTWTQPVARPPSRFGAAARTLASGPGWELRGDRGGDAWKGLPLSEAVSGPWRVWLLGELAGPEPGTPAQRAAADLEGGANPAAWNGRFLVFGWRADAREWHVWTDRFGILHCYFGRSGSRAALGTFFSAVAAAASGRRLDGEALCGFLACGFFPADRTFFDDVRILRPASHYTFDASGAQTALRRYAPWTRAVDRRRSLAGSAEELAGVLSGVLAEQTAFGRVAIPISGGLDSRTTVALLTEAGRPAPERFWAYTYGYADDSVETAIGRRVAESRGLPVRSLTIGRYLFERLDAVTDAVEGFQDVTQTRQAAISGLLSRDADFVVAAHWGDVWLDDMGAAHAVDGPEGLADHAYAKVRKRGREWLLREIGAPLVAGDDPEQVARGFVASELSRIGDLGDRDFQVKAFKTDQWSFRWTAASLRAYRLGAVPRLPFYDTRLGDFFSTVPTEQVAGRGLQIELLRRFAPDLARVPWQAFGTDLFRLRHWNTWMLPWRVARKAARMIRRGNPAAQRNWEVQFSGPGRLRLEERLLAAGRRLHALVAPDRIRKLLAEFDSEPLEEGRGYTVSMLLTLSEALERHGG